MNEEESGQREQQKGYVSQEGLGPLLSEAESHWMFGGRAMMCFCCKKIILFE